jgi:two-component system sensor histidine kinase DctS
VPIPLRVLLIDDSDADAALLLRALRDGGYEATWQRVDNADALHAALAEPWELVLCDWHMPGFGGAEALRILRGRGIDAPIIIVSSDLGEDGAVTAMKGGAHDYVTKHAPRRLLPAIQRELDEAETRRARRRAEAALRASEERFAKAFEFAPVGMAMVTIDGTTLKVNRALCDMFGYTEDELVDMPVWRITHPDDMPATFEHMRRLVEGEIDRWFLEKRYFHKDGHLVWGQSTTWLVRDEDGRARYVVSQVQDITEWKRLEEQSRRQHAELAHVLRVATMGETVAQIAHEINQPLASIANFANGLIARLDRDRVDLAAMRTVADEIAGEAVRASEVIRRLRNFLRKSEPKLVHCDANDVVRDALRLVEPDIRQHAIQLDLALAPQALPIEVDRVQVEQVVLNLLRNAVEALAACPDGARHLAVATELCAGHEVTVCVRDTGIGLPEAAGEAIFDAFFTTKCDGLGLGLSISRSIVQAHGGGLWARCNPGPGATVSFTLPSAA